ncbi:MAG: HAD family hydrolase [Flammeovirgaceae bacterium]
MSIFQNSAVQQGIKNVIFDLGGVLLNLDVDRTLHQFAAISGLSAEEIKHNISTLAFFIDYETGLITSAEFRNYLRRYLNTDIHDAALDNAWNAMLLDFPHEKLQLLQQLSKTHRTFLLSNTNEIHWVAFTESMHKQGIECFDACFEKAYYSHLLHQRKPDANVFKYVLETNQLLPQQTLFIDDTLANVESARQVGILAVHLSNPNQLFDVLR